MIGHAILGTNEVSRSRSCHDALLVQMGVARMMEIGEHGSALDVYCYG